MIEYGSKQWELMPELDVNEELDYKIIEKRRYDAFHGTILEELLHQMKVNFVTNLDYLNPSSNFLLKWFRKI